MCENIVDLTKNLKRCNKCIMPASYPDITFDNKNICSFCNTHDNKRFNILGKEKLEAILAEKLEDSSHKKRKYDCIVLLSGGKDSVYMLYYTVKHLKLKPIAVTYDNCFYNNIAKENAETACKKLDVPWKYIKVGFKHQFGMLREILKISEILGTFTHICGNCAVNVKTCGLNLAKEHKIPFVFDGVTSYEDFFQPSFAGLKSFMKKISSKNIVNILYHTGKYCYYNALQRIEMKYPLKERFLPTSRITFPKSIKIIRFYDFIEWDIMNKFDFLKNELGWKNPEGIIHRFDCILHNLINYRCVQQSGITSDGFSYANLVREGKMMREDALKNEMGIIERMTDNCRKVYKELGINDYNLPKIG